MMHTPIIEAYTIVSAIYDTTLKSALHDTRLEEQVNEKIAEGWQPYGPIVNANKDGVAFFAQPMVKYRAYGVAPEIYAQSPNAPVPAGRER